MNSSEQPLAKKPTQNMHSFSRPDSLRPGQPQFTIKKQDSKSGASQSLENGIDELFSKPPPRAAPSRVQLSRPPNMANRPIKTNTTSPHVSHPPTQRTTRLIATSSEKPAAHGPIPDANSFFDSFGVGDPSPSNPKQSAPKQVHIFQRKNSIEKLKSPTGSMASHAVSSNTTTRRRSIEKSNKSPSQTVSPMHSSTSTTSSGGGAKGFQTNISKSSSTTSTAVSNQQGSSQSIQPIKSTATSDVMNVPKFAQVPKTSTSQVQPSIQSNPVLINGPVNQQIGALPLKTQVSPVVRSPQTAHNSSSATSLVNTQKPPQMNMSASNTAVLNVPPVVSPTGSNNQNIVASVNSSVQKSPALAYPKAQSQTDSFPQSQLNAHSHSNIDQSVSLEPEINNEPPVIELDNERSSDGMEPPVDFFATDPVPPTQPQVHIGHNGNPFTETAGDSFGSQGYQDSFRIEKPSRTASQIQTSNTQFVAPTEPESTVDHTFEDVDTAPKASTVSFFSFASPRSTKGTELQPAESNLNDSRNTIPPANMQDLDDLVLGNTVSANNGTELNVNTSKPLSPISKPVVPVSDGNQRAIPKAKPSPSGISFENWNVVETRQPPQSQQPLQSSPHVQTSPQQHGINGEINAFSWNDHQGHSGQDADPFAWVGSTPVIDNFEEKQLSNEPAQQDSSTLSFGDWNQDFDFETPVQEPEVGQNEAFGQNNQSMQEEVYQPDIQPQKAAGEELQQEQHLPVATEVAAALPAHSLDQGQDSGIQWDQGAWEQSGPFWTGQDTQTFEFTSLQATQPDEVRTVQSQQEEQAPKPEKEMQVTQAPYISEDMFAVNGAQQSDHFVHNDPQAVQQDDPFAFAGNQSDFVFDQHITEPDIQQATDISTDPFATGGSLNDHIVEQPDQHTAEDPFAVNQTESYDQYPLESFYPQASTNKEVSYASEQNTDPFVQQPETNAPDKIETYHPSYDEEHHTETYENIHTTNAVAYNDPNSQQDAHVPFSNCQYPQSVQFSTETGDVLSWPQDTQGYESVYPEEQATADYSAAANVPQAQNTQEYDSFSQMPSDFQWNGDQYTDGTSWYQTTDPQTQTNQNQHQQDATHHYHSEQVPNDYPVEAQRLHQINTNEANGYSNTYTNQYVNQQNVSLPTNGDVNRISQEPFRSPEQKTANPMFSPPLDSALPLSEAAKYYGFQQSALQESLKLAEANTMAPIAETDGVNLQTQQHSPTKVPAPVVPTHFQSNITEPSAVQQYQIGQNPQPVAPPKRAPSPHRKPSNARSDFGVYAQTNGFESQRKKSFPFSQQSMAYPSSNPTASSPTRSVASSAKKPAPFAAFQPPAPIQGASSETTNPTSPITQTRLASPGSAMPLGDPLGRDHGHAIACFGFGGKIITIAPCRQTVYKTGQNGFPTGTEQSYPGSVQVHETKNLLYPEVKDEVETWFKGEGAFSNVKSQWKKKAMVDHLETKMQEVDVDVSPILQLAKASIETDGNILGTDGSGTKVPNGIQTLLQWLRNSDTPVIDGTPHDQILSHLKMGDKVGACQVACGYQLWSHALIIATHVNKETYMSVVSQFSKSVYPSQDDFHWTSHPELSVIYNLFAGADKLALETLSVAPPEQKAKTLEKWKSIVLVILANRPAGDLNCIMGLGELLISSGKVSAGQFCFLLASSLGCFAASETPNPHKVVLAGADHYKNPYSFMRSIKAIQLTEIFEAYSTKKVNGQFVYLLPLKLWYASYLADLGYLELASQYLEEVQADLKVAGKNGKSLINIEVERAAKTLGIWFASVGSLKTAKDKTTKSWLGKISSNFTGAALGRGLETLMNNAVGVEDTPNVTEQEQPALSFSPLPAPIIFEPIQPENNPLPAQAQVRGQSNGYYDGYNSVPHVSSYLQQSAQNETDASYSYASQNEQPLQDFGAVNGSTSYGTTDYATHEYEIQDAQYYTDPSSQLQDGPQQQYYYDNNGQIVYSEQGQYDSSHQENQYSEYDPQQDPQGYYDEFGQYHYYATENQTVEETVNQQHYTEAGYANVQPQGERESSQDQQQIYDESYGLPQGYQHQSKENAVAQEQSQYQYYSAEDNNVTEQPHDEFQLQQTQPEQNYEVAPETQGGYVNDWSSYYNDAGAESQAPQQEPAADNTELAENSVVDSAPAPDSYGGWSSFAGQSNIQEPQEEHSAQNAEVAESSATDNVQVPYSGWSSFGEQNNPVAYQEAASKESLPEPPSDYDQGSFFNPLAQSGGGFAIPRAVSTVSNASHGRISNIPSGPPTRTPSSLAQTPPVSFTPPAPELETLDEEDLGFGNSSFKKNNPEKTSSRSVKNEDAKPSETTKTEPEKPKAEEKKSGLISSFIGSIFGGGSKDKDKGPTAAHLPKGESTFYFDEKLKKWVNKNAGALAEAEKPLAPPPVTAPHSTPNATPMPSAPPSSEPSRHNSPMPPMGGASLTRSNTTQGSKRGARSRYVDIMNPNASQSEATPAEFVPPFGGITSLSNTNGGAEPKIFQPTFAPNPSQGSIYDQFTNVEPQNAEVAKQSVPQNNSLPPLPPAPRTGSAPPASNQMNATKPPMPLANHQSQPRTTNNPRSTMTPSFQPSITKSSPNMSSRGLGRPASNPAFGANKSMFRSQPNHSSSNTTVRQSAPPSDL